MSFTSPPYNRVRNDTYRYFDDISDDYLKLLVESTEEMLRVTDGYVIVNVQQNMCNKKELFDYLGHFSSKINGVFVWCKNNPQPANNYREKDDTISITNGFEYFFVLKDGKDFRAYGKEHCTNYLFTNVNNEHFEGHGAVMRYEVADYFIKRFSRSNDIVLDMFMGCGTTACACIKNNRRYIGYEITKEYCDICEQRIEQANLEMMQMSLFDFIKTKDEK